MKPIIGMTMNLVDGRYVINEPYVDMVLESGGFPLCIPTESDEVIDQLDGLLLSGGYDIDPKYYGEKPHPMLGIVTEKRDIIELNLVKKCLEKKIPILGICRGIQLLNVFFGGTLYQHIDKDITSLNHQQTVARTEKTHEVQIEKESRLFSIVEHSSLFVNSLHHQAIRLVGKGLKIVATASDGMIEGIELENYPYCIAVQWHPEELAKAGDIPSKKLFQSFINHASLYQKNKI